MSKESKEDRQVEINLALGAAELNERFRHTGEQIGQEQFDAAVRNAQRVTQLRKNDDGKFRVIGLDKYDSEDWLEGEFDSAEEAIEVAERRTNESKANCTSADVATVFFAYNPNGEYLGGDTWQSGEQGGLALTEEEQNLQREIMGVSPLDLHCQAVAHPVPGYFFPPNDSPTIWFQHPEHSNIFAFLIERGGVIRRFWCHNRNNVSLKTLSVEMANEQEVGYFTAQAN